MFAVQPHAAGLNLFQQRNSNDLTTVRPAHLNACRPRPSALTQLTCIWPLLALGLGSTGYRRSHGGRK